MKKMNKKGFTLIEMLVVIAIIAVLVSIVVPAVGNSTVKAQAATDAANLRSVAAEIAIDYLADNDLDKAYTMDCKLAGAEDCDVVAYLDGDEIVCYVTVDTNKYYTIEQLSTAANDGNKPTAGALPATPGTSITHTAPVETP